MKQAPDQKSLVASTLQAVIHALKRYYWIILAVLLLLLFKKTIVSALIVITLMAVAILSTISTRMVNFNFGFELITFVTVILAYAYSPLIAFISSIIMVFGSSLILGKLADPITIGRYGIYTVLCVLAAIFGGLEIRMAGRILTIVYNILMWGVYAMIKGFSPIGIIPVGVNVALNFFLFSTVAQPLLHALQ